MFGAAVSRSRVVAVVIALALAAAIAWRFDLLGLRTASVRTVFDRPPGYPGYVWTRNGDPVSNLEFETIAGPPHCGWESATFLFIGWPAGTVATTGAQARLYIRDPSGAVPGSPYRQLLQSPATLPSDARPTGYRHGVIEVYLSPSDQDQAIYVVSPSDAERWPRSDPMTLCN